MANLIVAHQVSYLFKEIWEDMVALAEAGALIMPAMPAFYQGPRTLDDLADFMAGRILETLGFSHELYPAWTG